jgi:hypothetical protein
MNQQPMKKYRIAVLDDYQNVALKSADWSVLRDRADIAVFQDHLAVCVMRERTRCPATSLSAFPISNLLPQRDL